MALAILHQQQLHPEATTRSAAQHSATCQPKHGMALQDRSVRAKARELQAQDMSPGRALFSSMSQLCRLALYALSIIKDSPARILRCLITLATSHPERHTHQG